MELDVAERLDEFALQVQRQRRRIVVLRDELNEYNVDAVAAPRRSIAVATPPVREKKDVLVLVRLELALLHIVGRHNPNVGATVNDRKRVLRNLCVVCGECGRVGDGVDDFTVLLVLVC